MGARRCIRRAEAHATADRRCFFQVASAASLVITAPTAWLAAAIPCTTKDDYDNHDAYDHNPYNHNTHDDHDDRADCVMAAASFTYAISTAAPCDSTLLEANIQSLQRFAQRRCLIFTAAAVAILCAVAAVGHRR